MPNPFYDAQAQAGADPADPGLAQGSPQFPAGSMVPAPGGGQPYPDPMSGVNMTGAGADEIGRVRDSLLQQFPDLTAADEPPMEMNTTQKLTLFGLFLANPQGAMDMIRERRERQARRQRLRAEIGLRMTGVAGEILKAQNESEKAILEARLRMNEEWRRNKEMEYNEHIERQKLALLQANAGLEARKYADSKQFQDRVLGMVEGGGGRVEYDAGGAGMSVPGPAPGAGMRRTFSVSPSGATATLSDPTLPAQRDPRVDFDSWVRARFPRGVPSRLARDQALLVEMYRRERAMVLQPGTFGSMASPMGGGYPDLFRPRASEPGYDDLSGDQIESYGE